MNKKDFRNHVLGFWSSHPLWARSRCAIFALLAFVPLAIVILAFLISVGDLDRLIPLITSSGTRVGWLTVAGIAASFGIGFASTMALCAHMGRWRAHGKLKRLDDRRKFSCDPVILVTALVLGAVGPFALSRLPGLSTSVRFLFALFAFLPLVGMLLAMRLGEQPGRDEGKYRTRRNPIFLVLLIIVLGLLGLSIAHDWAVLAGNRALASRLGGLLPLYSTYVQPLVGMAVLVPLAFVLYGLWQLFPMVVPLRQPDQTSAPRERRSLWLWFRDFFQDFFTWVRKRMLPGESGLEDDAKQPEWLGELLQTINDEFEVFKVELGDDEISRSIRGSDLKYVFGVDEPTMDQAGVLKRFREGYQEVLRGPGVSNGPETEHCADLLVTGNPGSGKTTALLACAVYAAFVRGQRVLYLVPDSLRQEAALARIETFLKKLHLHYYLRAAALSEDAVSRWLKGNDPVPHILVGTVAAAEQHLYGHQCLLDELPYLRRLVMLPGVILVDDFMDFEDSPRSHLPFLIDKHRLLLAAEYMPLQVVVTCRKLTKLGEETLGKRLFTVKHFDPDRNVLAMKPREGARAWRVRLRTDDVPRTVDKMVEWCLRRGLDVVLYRAGIDESQRRAEERALAEKAGSDRITVLADLERPVISPSPPEVDAIFYHEAVQEDICLALRLHAGNDDTVIFSVSPKGATRQVAEGVVPVVADRAAKPLLAVHLNSIARFLRVRAPIRIDHWNKFGVEHGSTAELAPGVSTADSWFFVDRWDELDYQLDIWPYITLAKSSVSRERVCVFGLPDPTWNIYSTRAGDRLVVGRPGASETEGKHLARRARWYDAETDFGEIGDVDLAHAHRFKLTYGHRSIGLRTIRQAENGSVRLASEVWHGSGEDRYLPVYQYAWEFPIDQQAGTFWGSPEDGLRWFQLTSPTANAVQVESQIIGHMSEYGATSDISPVKYAYPANCHGLLLQPKLIRPEVLAETIGTSLGGSWSTDDHDRFWPELTAALNHALLTHLPGFHYFARVLAFSAQGEAEKVAPAVIWFVEPISGGQTAARLMADLLRFKKQRGAFFESVRWFLEQIRPDGPSASLFMRRSTHMGFKGDDRIRNPAEALSLIAEVQSAQK